jgi:hypothetical protein
MNKLIPSLWLGLAGAALLTDTAAAQVAKPAAPAKPATTKPAAKPAAKPVAAKHAVAKPATKPVQLSQLLPSRLWPSQ